MIILLLEIRQRWLKFKMNKINQILLGIICGLMFFFLYSSNLKMQTDIEKIQNHLNFIKNIRVENHQNKINEVILNSDDVHYMALTMYHEARNQSEIGRIAVGFVILNRVQSSNFPKTIKQVVLQSKQFSWTNTTKSEPKDSDIWEECKQISESLLLNEYKKDPTNGSTHYCTVTNKNQWKNTMKKVVQIDNHIFYKEEDINE